MAPVGVTMERATYRRQFLAVAGASLGAAVAGCTDLTGDESDNDDGSDDGDDGPDDGDDGPDDSTFPVDGERVDDWKFDPRQMGGGDGGVTASTGSSGGSAGGAQYSAAPESEDLGLAAGGAGNVATFRRNVREGYLPQPESVAYEGLFYDYFFDTGGGSCSELFCPAYSPAAASEPMDGGLEPYLTVGLDSSLTASSFERPALNLVVVLDISGSMDGTFEEYYYDRTGQRREVEGETDRLKIDVASEALVALTEQLRPEDRLGVVLYNNTDHLAKPLNPVAETDMDAIREHMREDLIARGGTNTEAGIDRATSLLRPHADADPTERENRTMLITDAMPNIGDTSVEGLRGTLEANADDGLYTSVVGVGLDFNTELVDRITSIEGANYSGVNSADEFRERLGERFEYMVSPLVFDLSLELDSSDYRIDCVYGTTAADETTGELAHVNTLFPSPTEDGGTRGGVVLVETEPTGDPGDGPLPGGTVSLTASWRTRAGDTQSTTERVVLPAEGEHYDSTGVRKAILLQRYGTLLRNWIAHERGRMVVTEASADIEAPDEPRELGQWEQQSVDLTVTPPYDERFAAFREHFASEAAAIGDEDLDRELEIIDRILAAA